MLRYGGRQALRGPCMGPGDLPCWAVGGVDPGTASVVAGCAVGSAGTSVTSAGCASRTTKSTERAFESREGPRCPSRDTTRPTRHHGRAAGKRAV